MPKILALDVEGTIITGYDYSQELSKGRYAAVINPELPTILQRFKSLGFKIVLATGTDGDNLAYYSDQFTTAGIRQYIDEFTPREHSAGDGKEDKLVKYANQYQTSVDQIYFYDDGLPNVQRAREKGIVNSFHVTDEHPLVEQLRRDLDLCSQLAENSLRTELFVPAITYDLQFRCIQALLGLGCVLLALAIALSPPVATVFGIAGTLTSNVATISAAVTVASFLAAAGIYAVRNVSRSSVVASNSGPTLPM